MKLYQIDMCLYKVASRKDWTVFSGEGRMLEEGKYKDMVERYQCEEVLFMNMADHRIYLHDNESEIRERLYWREYALKEAAQEA